jgi:hypothetical protein
MNTNNINVDFFTDRLTIINTTDDEVEQLAQNYLSKSQLEMCKIVRKVTVYNKQREILQRTLMRRYSKAESSFKYDTEIGNDQQTIVTSSSISQIENVLTLEAQKKIIF